MLEIWNKPQHREEVDNALARLAAALKVEGTHDLHFIINQAAADLEQHAGIKSELDNYKAATRVAGDPREQAAQYLYILRRFVSGNKIPRDLASRIRKAGEELGELGEAAILSTGIANRDVMSEAADLINVGIDILMICHDDRPDSMDKVFPWLIYNLLEKAEKYDRGENRIGGRD